MKIEKRIIYCTLACIIIAIACAFVFFDVKINKLGAEKVVHARAPAPTPNVIAGTCSPTISAVCDTQIRGWVYICANGTVYVCRPANGGWKEQMDIIGTTGATGRRGRRGPTGSTGATGATGAIESTTLPIFSGTADVVVVGESLAYSSDGGDTFTSIHVNGFKMGQDVAYSLPLNRWIAVGSEGILSAIYSDDGGNWFGSALSNVLDIAGYAIVRYFWFVLFFKI